MEKIIEFIANYPQDRILLLASIIALSITILIAFKNRKKEFKEKKRLHNQLFVYQERNIDLEKDNRNLSIHIWKLLEKQKRILYEYTELKNRLTRKRIH
jgi:hypothetical protein